jgi:hypothetical protein
VGVCYDFKGAPSTIAPAAGTDVKNSFTIEFWAKPTATRASSTEQNANFTISGVSGQRYAVFPPQKGAVDAGVGVSVGTNGVSVFEHGNDHLPSILVYDTPINDWTHVVVTYDLHRPKLYLNGTLVRTGIKSFRANIYPGTQLGGQATNILGRGDTYGPYLGLLDEFRLYPTVITPQQIAQNYNDGLVGEGGPTRILTQEHSVDDLWTLNTFEVFSNGSLTDTPIPVDTVTIVSGTSETYMTIDDPVGAQTQGVTIDYSCENTENLSRDIIVEFSENGGNSWSQATLSTASTAGGVSENRILDVPCSSTGSDHSFIWNSELDGAGAQGAANPNVQVRVTADTSLVGASILTATTNSFEVENAAAPEVLASTFLGGDEGDDAVGIGFDTTGNPVVIGHTSSPTFPTTVGAFQESDPTDEAIFVTVFNPELTAVSYSTLIGGDDYEFAISGTVDENGNVYVYGFTDSTDFPQPAVPNGFDTSVGPDDSFLLKMDPDIDEVLYFSFLGGGDYDSGTGIDVDPTDGRVALAGWTYSNDFPTTVNAFDSTYGGDSDGYVALFDTTLSGSASLVYSSYVGGSSDDFGDAVRLGASDSLYLAGFTMSSDFSADPTGSGSFDETFDTVNGDGFLMQIDSLGDVSYVTAIGGDNGDDGIADMALSGSDVYLCGSTSSSDFTTTNGVLGSTLQGDNDVFVYKMNLGYNSSDDLLEGTLVGGSGSIREVCRSMVVEDDGDVVFVGVGGVNYPTTSGAFDQTYNGAGSEGNLVVTKIDSSFSEVVYSTYFDGSDEFSARGDYDTIAQHSSGDVYIVGSTRSADFPVFNGFDSVYGDTGAFTTDAYVARFVFPEPVVEATDESFITIFRN